MLASKAFEEIITHPYKFELFQLCHILEQLQFKIKILPIASLSFPGADISAIDVSNDTAIIYTRYFGLYGVDAPLPALMLEELMLSDRESSALLDFIDIINVRLGELLYNAWKKSKLYFSSANKLMQQITSAIAGRQVNSNINYLEFTYAAVLNFGGFNVIKLKLLLNQLFPGLLIKVDVVVGRIKFNEYKTKLGEFFLGNYALAYNNIIISLGILNFQQFIRILEEKQLMHLKYLLAKYSSGVNYKINLHINKQDALMLNQMYLGYNAAIGYGDIVKIILL